MRRHARRPRAVTGAIVALVALGPHPAGAAPTRYGAFMWDSLAPERLVMDRVLRDGAVLDFYNLMRDHPGVTLAVLDNPGGDRAAALAVADAVAERHLDTLVPLGGRCSLNCAYVFFAGDDRLAEGELILPGLGPPPQPPPVSPAPAATPAPTPPPATSAIAAATEPSSVQPSPEPVSDNSAALENPALAASPETAPPAEPAPSPAEPAPAAASSPPESPEIPATIVVATAEPAAPSADPIPPPTAAEAAAPTPDPGASPEESSAVDAAPGAPPEGAPPETAPAPDPLAAAPAEPPLAEPGPLPPAADPAAATTPQPEAAAPPAAEPPPSAAPALTPTPSAPTTPPAPAAPVAATAPSTQAATTTTAPRAPAEPTLAELHTLLRRYGVPHAIVALMDRTPLGTSYRLTPGEIADYGLNRERNGVPHPTPAIAYLYEETPDGGAERYPAAVRWRVVAPLHGTASLVADLTSYAKNLALTLTVTLEPIPPAPNVAELSASSQLTDAHDPAAFFNLGDVTASLQSLALPEFAPAAGPEASPPPAPAADEITGAIAPPADYRYLVTVTPAATMPFPGDGLAAVPRLMLKDSEPRAGTPLPGPAETAAGAHLIHVTLSPDRALALLEDAPWFDLPLIYADGQRAILAFSKGTYGDTAFAAARAAWEN